VSYQTAALPSRRNAPAAAALSETRTRAAGKADWRAAGPVTFRGNEARQTIALLPKLTARPEAVAYAFGTEAGAA
jgi:hypothetical protein